MLDLDRFDEMDMLVFKALVTDAGYNDEEAYEKVLSGEFVVVIGDEYADIGEWLVDSIYCDEIPDKLQGYIDTYKLGRDYCYNQSYVHVIDKYLTGYYIFLEY